jgi:hypothetical protein
MKPDSRGVLRFREILILSVFLLFNNSDVGRLCWATSTVRRESRRENQYYSAVGFVVPRLRGAKEAFSSLPFLGTPPEEYVVPRKLGLLLFCSETLQ